MGKRKVTILGPAVEELVRVEQVQSPFLPGIFHTIFARIYPGFSIDKEQSIPREPRPHYLLLFYQ
jgi:hypothetical protein